MFEPDYNNSRDFILSNDAFFYLYAEEDPLDDDNLDEALEVAECFPNGFIIKEGWQYIDDDMIEATFIPLVQKEVDFDAEQEMAKGYFFRIRLCPDCKHIELYSYRVSTGQTVYKGTYELRLNSTGKEIGFAAGDWRKGKGCLLWLKHFKEVSLGRLKIRKDLLLQGL